MPDFRTKRQKLQAMAAQTVSPHEAEVARRLLTNMDGKGPKREGLKPTHTAFDELKRSLTRDDIKAQPGKPRSGATVTVGGTTFDIEDFIIITDEPWPPW